VQSQLVAEKKGVSPDQANATVSRWEQQMLQARDQAKQKATEYGKRAAKGVSKAALATFFMLLIGAIAGTFGGGLGAPKDQVAAVREMRRVA
jgi:hypothetical protein